MDTIPEMPSSPPQLRRSTPSMSALTPEEERQQLERMQEQRDSMNIRVINYAINSIDNQILGLTRVLTSDQDIMDKVLQDETNIQKTDYEKEKVIKIAQFIKDMHDIHSRRQSGGTIFDMVKCNKKSLKRKRKQHKQRKRNRKTKKQK